MIAASTPVQRPANARLLAVDSNGNISHRARSEFVSLFRPGDLVVANDAATLPASLQCVHLPTGRPVEVRLAGLESLRQFTSFKAVVFGEGDFHTRTEDRPQPPTLRPGDRLASGSLRATITRILNHPRFVSLTFEGSTDEIWEGLARQGRPIQYAHISAPLDLWDTWTPIAGQPVAFEPPSAGFALSWDVLHSLTSRGIRFATITHAAGISSTGDNVLDALLPLDEPYRIPRSTAALINETKAAGGRIVAIGTTVVRALEHSGSLAGEGLANQKIGPATRLRVVDAIFSGTHEPGTSHRHLLGAFADPSTLARMDWELDSHLYRTHEFGDSVLLEARLRNSEHREILSEQSCGAHIAG